MSATKPFRCLWHGQSSGEIPNRILESFGLRRRRNARTSEGIKLSMALRNYCKSTYVTTSWLRLSRLQPVSRSYFLGQHYVPPTTIPVKHKLAMVDLPIGSHILMYGGIVGRVREPIPRGGLLNKGNVQHETTDSAQRDAQFVGRLPMSRASEAALPTGATISFSPRSVTADGGTHPIQIRVQAAAQKAALNSGSIVPLSWPC
jgi:hypothetical protein